MTKRREIRYAHRNTTEDGKDYKLLTRSDLVRQHQSAHSSTHTLASPVQTPIVMLRVVTIWSTDYKPLMHE